jgi:hypothetical protein
MTLGPALMLVAVSDETEGIIARWITTFGRVPLFYYIAQIYLLHATATLFAWITIGGAVFVTSHKPDGYGVGCWLGRNLFSVAGGGHSALSARQLVCRDQAAAH